MRLVALGLALGLGVAIAALASAQVSVAPLAPGEVLVQTSSLGRIVSAPDRARLGLLVSAEGPNSEIARRETRTRLARVNAVLAAAGIAPADIQGGEVSDGFAYSAMSPDLLLAAGNYGPSGSGAETASAALQVTIRDVGRLAALRESLQALDIVIGTPSYFLADDSAARSAARAQAMAKARAEAETHAASLNLRVVRIARVTERIGLEGLNLVVTEAQAIGGLFTRMGRPSRDVETMVAVGVDFVLAPR